MTSSVSTPASSLHPLQQRVQLVARRASRLRLFHALGRWVAGVVGVLLLVCVADYAFRLQDAGMRWLLSLAALGFSGWWMTRTIIRVWRAPQNATQVARHIENYYPQLRDRLTSALEFLEEDKHHNAGSADLKRAVIDEAADAAAALDFQQCVNPRNTRRSIAIGLATACAAFAIASMNAPLAARAAQRLIMPWGGPQWPRVNDLKYLNPASQAVRGEEIIVRVVDAAEKLPNHGLLEVWYEGDEQDEIQMLPMTRQGNTLVAPLNKLTRTVSFRASAGDDRLSWWTVEVVEPPTVSRWAVTVTPPRYTRATAQVVGESIQALSGASLSTAGEFSRSMTHAALVTSDHQQRLPLTLSEDGLTFRLESPWKLEREGAFQMRLEASDHAATYQIGRVIDVRVALDSPPTISWELPGDGHSATVSSQLAIRGVVKDNASIRAVALTIEFPNQVQRRIELLGAPSESSEDGLSSRVLDPSNDQPLDLRVFDFNQLRPLSQWGVRPGDELKLRIEARDFQPEAEAATTISDWRLLRIVSAEQMVQLVGQKQAAIFQKLEELLELQRATSQRTSDIHATINDTIAVEDRESLQNVELQQRRITHGLGGAHQVDRAGLIGEVTSVLDELQLSGEAADVERRLTELKLALEQSVASHTTAIERRLVAAVRHAVSGGSSDATRKELSQARRSQRALISTLESLLTDARQWTTYQQAAQELGRVIDGQLVVQKATDELHVQQLTSPNTNRAREQGAQVAQDQAVLGRRFDKLLAELRMLRAKLQPADQQVVDRAIQHADSLRISSDFRRCASLLESQRWGTALEGQDSLLENLRVLLETLTQQDSRDASSLRQLADEVRKLEGQVGDSAQQWRAVSPAPAAPPDEAMKEEIKRQAQGLAERARGLAAEARKLAPGAAELIIAAHFRLAKAQTEDLAPSASADEADHAAKMLADAAAEIAKLDSSSSKPGQSLTTQMRADVDALLARQALLLDSVKQLTSAAALDDFLKRRQEQFDLVRELQATVESWHESPVLQAGLALAQDPMARAADELQQQRAADSLSAMALAVEKLEVIQSILKGAVPPDATASQTTQAVPPNPQSQTTASTRSLLRLPELKMLTVLQQGLLDRTGELDAVKTKRTLTASETRELSTLANRQGQIVDWLNSLLDEKVEDPSVPSPPASSIDQLLDTLK